MVVHGFNKLKMGSHASLGQGYSLQNVFIGASFYCVNIIECSYIDDFMTR